MKTYHQTDLGELVSQRYAIVERQAGRKDDVIARFKRPNMADAYFMQLNRAEKRLKEKSD